jgi:hypothetical protein
MLTTEKIKPTTKEAFNAGNYVDPNIALTRFFDVVAALTDAELPGNGKIILITSTLAILTTIDSLLELEFWDSLLFDPEMPPHILPDAKTRETRRKSIEARVAQLGQDCTTSADVTEAMDFAHRVVDGLDREFSNGVMPAGTAVPQDERFFCAALIPTLSQLFAEVWVPRREDPLRARNVPAGRRCWRG